VYRRNFGQMPFLRQPVTDVGDNVIQTVVFWVKVQCFNPCVGFGVVRIHLLHFLAGCHKGD